MATRLEHWSPARLKPHPRNSKTHGLDQVDELASLILKVGFTKPIIVDETDTILAGHGARLAAMKLGMELVPVVVLSHLTPAMKRAYLLGDNRIAEKSGWNYAMAAEELAALDLEKFDFTLTGFSDADLEQMLDDLAGGPTPRNATKPERGPRMSTDTKTAATPAAAAGVFSAPSKEGAAPATAAPSAASVASESDARTVNSTDAAGNVMRHAYRVLSDDEKQLMVEVKDAGLLLWNKIHSLEAAGSRELSIAKTKTEEAVMWAIKHLTA
jgi:hypothetical protein